MMQRDAMQREQPPSWLGPATAALMILMLIGLVVLIWITVFATGEEDQAEGVARHLLGAITYAHGA